MSDFDPVTQAGQHVTQDAGKAWRFQALEQTSSTNADAMAAALAGDPGSLWISAQSQSAGRGRLNRPWMSPPGNLHASVLLIDPAPLQCAPQLSFVMAVSLVEALEALGVARTRLSIKWPNDVLLDGAKLSGILIEGSMLPDGRFACVAGIGVNCAQAPELAAYRATSLASQGYAIAPGAMLQALSAAFARWLALWNRSAGFAAVREAWLARAAGLGQTIVAAGATGRVDGIFAGLDEQGRLLLDTDAGRRIVDAADITLQGGLTAPPGRTAEG